MSDIAPVYKQEIRDRATIKAAWDHMFWISREEEAALLMGERSNHPAAHSGRKALHSGKKSPHSSQKRSNKSHSPQRVGKR